MATITVGNSPVNRATATTPGNTFIGRQVAANGTGIITKVEIWVEQAGTFEVAIFYFASAPRNYTTRANASVGALGTNLQTINGLNLAVQTGDYIGGYTVDGRFSYDLPGGASSTTGGDQIPCTNTNFTDGAWYLSIRGTGTTVPAITNLSADHGVVGASITITGTSFDAVQAPSGQVTFNGTAAAITSWADTSIVCTVPVGATTGNIVVTNSTGGVSSGTAFTVDTNPTITLLNPDTGPVGTSVTITGTLFGAVQGNGRVRFNGTEATITSWADTSIVCTVPPLATTGPVVVTNNAGALSAGTTMTVSDVPPYITDGLTTGDDESADFYACTRLGQFFVPTTTLSSLAVKVKGNKSGSPGTTTFEIHLADAQHKPTGAVLATGTTDANTWTTDASGQWVIVPVTAGVILHAGTEYTLTWYAAAGDAGNKGQSRRSSTGGYGNGGVLSSADCGTTWTVTTTKDFVFQVIGSTPQSRGTSPTPGHGLGVLGTGAILGYCPLQG